MNPRGAQAYKQVYFNSASPIRLLDELYERLLRDLAEARAAIVAGDVAEKARTTSHALAILEQLQLGLDPKRAPEMCANLEALYRFARERILDGSLRMAAQPIDEAVVILTPVRDGFRVAGGLK